MAVELHGYQFSVYTRIARIVLAEKSVSYTRIEVDPFQDFVPEQYRAMHPFLRVPTLVHDDFVLYETSAISRYVDDSFDGPLLQPSNFRERAKMAQIISVIDNYGYWPMVRQVASQRIFRPLAGERADEQEVQRGLKKSIQVLDAIEELITGRQFLVGTQLSLCDIHLAPMIAYFAMTAEGVTALSGRRRLSRWWTHMKEYPSVVATDPGLPNNASTKS
jgi:glutathione S-transferase